MASLNASLGAALERFESAVRQVLEVQFDDLASEVLEIEASPYGRVALQLGAVEPTGFDGRRGHGPSRAGRCRLPAPSLGRRPRAYLKKFNSFWGAGNGVKAASGSNGHTVVLKVGHAFGKKFKPWEAVKTANNDRQGRQGRRRRHRYRAGGVRSRRRGACCCAGRAGA